MTPLHKNRGIMLMELLATLVLLAVLAVLVGQIFITSVNTMQNATKRENLLLRTDAAISLLRRDTWSAEKITIAESNHVNLNMPSGELISWQTAGATLSRTANAQTQSWSDLPEIHFSSDGPTLTLRIQNDSLTLISQTMLQRRSP
ncbi:MAG: hypothetical protein FWD53_04650 [Phycisphaerales bacterium]|nr:hypothetical protein [Phycisphaerales bacterium]